MGPTAIKRWADEGLLPCVRTAGGHRRFREEDLATFLKAQDAQLETNGAPNADAVRLLDAALDDSNFFELQALLLSLRGRMDGWFRVASIVGTALIELGQRWKDGELSVLQEHVASERLSRALSRIVESMPVASTAPTALLCCVERDEHSLGLSCVELCLREAGWGTRWAGRNTPLDAVIEAIQDGVELVAVSASSWTRDRALLSRWSRQLGAACKEHDTALVFGGEGEWPEPLVHGHRFRSFDALNGFLAGASQRRANPHD